ncbi:hypothetical protein BGX38DRAFT_249776 [Terfezia claveryi]|nr:hypothetical protein BGX38DRAFT_249776 [Terfezia claveryi]
MAMPYWNIPFHSPLRCIVLIFYPLVDVSSLCRPGISCNVDEGSNLQRQLFIVAAAILQARLQLHEQGYTQSHTSHLIRGTVVCSYVGSVCPRRNIRTKVNCRKKNTRNRTGRMTIDSSVAACVPFESEVLTQNSYNTGTRTTRCHVHNQNAHTVRSQAKYILSSGKLAVHFD